MKPVFYLMLYTVLIPIAAIYFLANVVTNQY